VRVDFNGECGHGWSLILQQRKGVITLYTRMLDEVWEELEFTERGCPNRDQLTLELEELRQKMNGASLDKEPNFPLKIVHLIQIQVNNDEALPGLSFSARDY
jgi:hypothetical protein